MDNTLLRTASIVGKFSLYFLYVFLALIVLGLGYLLISGDTAIFSMLYLTEDVFIISTDGSVNDAVSSIPHKGLLYYYGIKAIFSTVCYLFIIRESLHIVNSIKSLETFRMGNIRSFRRIGHLFIALFLVNLIHLGYDSASWELTFQFDPIYLLGTLAGYLLAEIFREGNKLMEENKLTI